ncbi:MAG: hypothetical protein EXX96DRAFT_476384 [Benjaminiella poitrasii]|nr:MAG: hypothetical protein EXX96DRAFT_476384 [Benjaminiella poitrasii]
MIKYAYVYLIKCAKNLKERSLANKVFFGVYCSADDDLLTRDMKRNEDLLSKINADDMLQHISTAKKVCLVAIDFAGLTTNQEDLKIFLKNNYNVSKIIFEKLLFTNSTHVYDSHDLLNSNKIADFNGRKGFLQRSK